MVDDLDIARARAVAAAVPDPELPFLSVEDLGILREVSLEHGEIVAKLTPTYTGCPAVSVIEHDVLSALQNAGFKARVQRVESPAWTTAWISAIGLEKLRSNGISPPDANSSTTTQLFATRRVICPHCQSDKTAKVSEFGSTPCKAQYRCQQCKEPFDHFKCH